MDDVAAAVVDGAEGAEPATAPEAEGTNRIHQRDPEWNEERPRLEADAPEQRAAQDDDRDRREDELEVDEGRRGEAHRGDQSAEQRDTCLLLEVSRPGDRVRYADE